MGACIIAAHIGPIFVCIGHTFCSKTEMCCRRLGVKKPLLLGRMKKVRPFLGIAGWLGESPGGSMGGWPGGWLGRSMGG